MAANVTDGTNSTFVTLPNGEPFLVKVILTPGEAGGVMVPVVFSIFSLMAILAMFSVICTSAIRTYTRTGDLFVRTPIAAYFICFLVADFFQTIAFMMNSQWHNTMSVEHNSYCVAQGALKQFSDVALALWALIMATHIGHTFFLQIEMHRYVFWATLVAGWTTTGAITVGSSAVLNTAMNGPFWGIAGQSCWITERYHVPRLTCDSLFIFFSALFCALLFAAAFLRLRGNLVGEGTRWAFRRASAPQNGEELREFAKLQDSYVKKVTSEMMLYPAVYAAVVFPYLANRLAESSGNTPSFGGKIFADTIYSLHGLINVVLFVTLNRHLLPRESILPSSISAPTLQTTTAPLPLSPNVAEKAPGLTVNIRSPAPGQSPMVSVSLAPGMTTTRGFKGGKDEEDPYYKDDGAWMEALPTQLPEFQPRAPPGLAGAPKVRVGRLSAGPMPSAQFVGAPAGYNEEDAAWDKPMPRGYAQPLRDDGPQVQQSQEPYPTGKDAYARGENTYSREEAAYAQEEPRLPSPTESEFRARLDDIGLARSPSMDRHVSQLYRSSTAESRRPDVRDIERGEWDRPRH